MKLKKGAEPAFTPSTRRASILVPAGQVNVLRNKVRRILAVLSEELVVHNRKKARRVRPPARRDSPSRAGRAFSAARRGRLRRSDPGERQETEDCGRRRRRRVGRRGGPKQTAEEPDDLKTLAKGYDYLLSMRLWALTRERVDALRAELSEKDAELRRSRPRPPLIYG